VPNRARSWAEGPDQDLEGQATTDGSARCILRPVSLAERSNSMSNQAWYYFLSLEKDFVRTIDFIHLDPANFKAFSNEYAKLLLLIGSETDVVAKMLCEKIGPAGRFANIED
jgi:hypothetical protein